MTADSPLKLDERTEQLIREYRAAGGIAATDLAVAALRTRIRELVEEARRGRPVTLVNVLDGNETNR